MMINKVCVKLLSSLRAVKWSTLPTHCFLPDDQPPPIKKTAIKQNSHSNVDMCKNYINTLTNEGMRGALGFYLKYLNLGPEDEEMFSRIRMTWVFKLSN